MLLFRKNLLLYTGFILSVSCNNDVGSSRGPIVLGDSSLIVTETDPKYLTNYVTDIQLLSASADSAATDTFASNSPASGQARSEGEGLQIAFKEITVFIPDIATKTYTPQEPEKSAGVSYQIVDGKIRGNSLHLTRSEITRVSQRYMTTVVVKNKAGARLILETLNYTTAWDEITGKDGIYPVTGLEDAGLTHAKASAATIRNAVTQMARRKRYSRQDIRAWEAAVRQVRSIKDDPLTVVLRSVMWKIEGKDKDGKPYVKQVRLDLSF